MSRKFWDVLGRTQVGETEVETMGVNETGDGRVRGRTPLTGRRHGKSTIRDILLEQGGSE